MITIGDLVEVITPNKYVLTTQGTRWLVYRTYTHENSSYAAVGRILTAEDDDFNLVQRRILSRFNGQKWRMEYDIFLYNIPFEDLEKLDNRKNIDHKSLLSQSLDEVSDDKKDEGQNERGPFRAMSNLSPIA